MAKKQLIIDKSLELFAKQGFEATSIQQITDLAGISKGAFYLSFKSKDELILAIIDHFMMQIITDIDQSVRAYTLKGNILYEFYYTTFQSFRKHTGFAKIFVKEQVLPLNEELISKLHEYDNQINYSILYVLQKQYEDEAKDCIYDLLICVKGFMRMYAELFVHHELNLNLDLFVQSLVEKTNILAKHMSTPFISEETFKKMIGPSCHKYEEEDEPSRLIMLIEQKIPELEDAIEIESLQLLKEALLSEAPSLALIKGMLGNLEGNMECKWISYLVSKYYKL